MSYCSVNGIKIYYEVSGEGVPLLLIHANPFDHRLWQYQIASFSTFFKVVAVDLRGYGHSDKPTTDTTLAVKNLTARLPELRMPVLTLNGEFDGTLPRTREMSQKIHGAVHQVIPGAGHACCLENPTVFDRLVREFLKQHNFVS